MRHNSFALNHITTSTVEFKRGDSTLTLTVAPFPYGFDVSFAKICKQPTPPVKNVIEKGQSRREVNENDPTYLANLDEFESLRTAYMFYLALRKDVNISWDNTPSDEKGIRGLKDEIIEAGFSMQEVNAVVAAAITCGRVTDDQKKEADKDF